MDQQPGSGNVLKARSGHSRVLVLRGEPGSGKTALLDDLIARAAGMSVIRLPGVQSEMELAYGTLHGPWSQLAEEDVKRLPGPSEPRSGSRSALRLGPHRVRSRWAGNAEWPRGSRRAAATACCRRRCPVARPGVGTDACFCRGGCGPR